MNAQKHSYESEELDLREVGTLINQARVIARQYRDLTGRPLGITGEVAEYEAARLLNLRLCVVRQAGYDAIRPDGLRIQIKGRVLLDAAKPGQRIGRIRLDHDWDSVLLVSLDENFEPIEIYEAARADVEAALLAPGSRARNERGALSVSKFHSISKMVWSRVSGAAGTDTNVSA